MDGLLDNDEAVRKNAADTLYDTAYANPKYVEDNFEAIADVLKQTDDSFVALRISSAISNAATQNQGFYTQNFDSLFEIFDNFLQKDITPENYWDGAMMNLYHPIQSAIDADPTLKQKALPMLFRLTKSKGNVRFSAAAPIMQLGMQQPHLLKDYVRDIFAAVKTGFNTLTSSLLNLYSYDSDAFVENTDFLLEQYRTDVAMKGSILALFDKMAVNHPELFIDHIGMFIADIMAPGTGQMVAMLIEKIVKDNPDSVYPFVNQMLQAIQYNEYLLYMIPNILGFIGQTSPERAKEMLKYLNELLDKSRDATTAAILSEFWNLAEIDRALLDPYVERIRNYESDAQEYVRDNAKRIIDYYERKDIRSLASTVEEQNAKIREAVKSTEELKAYIDENIDMLKEFIADIVKKLPIPSKFSTEGKIRKTVKLHFVCGKHGDRCLFPEDRPFTTETKDWNKWFKIALSGVKLGKSVFMPMKAGDAIGAVKNAYEAYKGKDDKDFLAYISEPFLTSEEQDNLVNQLRAAKFFDVFTYDAKTADWICTMCNLT